LTGSASKTITVLPTFPDLEGSVDIEFQDTTPATVPAAGVCLFHYRLVSLASLPVTLTITPTVSPTGALSQLAVLNDAQIPVPSGQITVGSKLKRDFFIRATVTGAPTTFTLTVHGEGQGLSPPPAINPFTVGAAGSQDEHIELDLKGAMDDTGADVLDESTGTVAVGANAPVQVTYEARFDSAGTYVPTTAFDPSTGGWSEDVSAIPDPIVASANEVITFEVVLTAPSTPPSQPIRYIVTIRNENEDPTTGLKRERTLNLKLAT
jgi:hypothetical protein